VLASSAQGTQKQRPLDGIHFLSLLSFCKKGMFLNAFAPGFFFSLLKVVYTEKKRKKINTTSWKIAWFGVLKTCVLLFPGTPVVWGHSNLYNFSRKNMLGAVFKRDLSVLSFSGVTDHHNIKILSC
jgi:hypothetical protein